MYAHCRVMLVQSRQNGRLCNFQLLKACQNSARDFQDPHQHRISQCVRRLCRTQHGGPLSAAAHMATAAVPPMRPSPWLIELVGTSSFALATGALSISMIAWLCGAVLRWRRRGITVKEEAKARRRDQLRRERLETVCQALCDAGILPPQRGAAFALPLTGILISPVTDRSPCSTPESCSPENTPPELRKARFVNTDRDDEEAKQIALHAVKVVEHAAAVEDERSLASLYHSLLERARTSVAPSSSTPAPRPRAPAQELLPPPELELAASLPSPSQQTSSPTKPTVSMAPSAAARAPPSPLPAPFEWVGNTLVELNSGRRLHSNAQTGVWTFQRGERLQETMLFRARARALHRLQYQVTTYKRMFGKYVLVHRASPVEMGSFSPRDEGYEFKCPVQCIPNGPKAFLCGMNRTVIEFTSAEGVLFQREVFAELR